MATGYGVTAIFMWGLLALLGTLTDRVPPFQLLAICFGISALLMLLRRAWIRQPLWQPPCLTVRAWLIGVAGLFGFHFCYFMALRLAPAIEVSLIAYLWPLLLSLMVARPGNRISALFGGLLGFVGVSVMMLAGGSLSLHSQALPGYLFALACAGIWSTYSWYLSKSPGHVDDIGWLSLAVALLSWIAHLILETGSWQLNLSAWLGLLLLGLGPVGGAFYLWDNGLKYGNRQLLASLSFGVPLISSVALAVAGRNPWSGEIVLALVLVMLGAGMTRRPIRQSPINNQPVTED